MQRFRSDPEAAVRSVPVEINIKPIFATGLLQDSLNSQTVLGRKSDTRMNENVVNFQNKTPQVGSEPININPWILGINGLEGFRRETL